MSLKEMGEDGITEYLARKYSTDNPRVIRAIGDDTAVLSETGGSVQLATTDILIEGTHFRRDLTTPYLLGSKALAVSLSDIAAMGGEPLFYLVTLNLPPNTEAAYLKNLYKGLDKEAKKFGVTLTGGNLSRAKSISISITLLGQMPADEVLYRDGAKPGDDIYITGNPGDSAIGLAALKKYGGRAITKGPLKRQVRKHLEPQPRIDVGRKLAQTKRATAMMDISDGLLLDLGRLCRASKAGACIEADKIPFSRALLSCGREKALKTALGGGEDYELLFTASSHQGKKILNIEKTHDVKVTRIGRILPAGEGIFVTGANGKKLKINTMAGGFRHF
ncbi:MAG: thiamine-phosphate kinase [Thermodesulfobacteriota bacterium]